MYKVLITTAGLGSRLGELTSKTNKSLIKINDKLVIDYIIESYDTSLPLIISIGYLGNTVMSYVKKTYPNRDITFVSSNPYKGAGSSLGYSMLAAKELLQCPFIFHCNDTIVQQRIPSPEKNNWDGVSLGDNPTIFNSFNYSSVNIKNNYISEIHKKGAKEFEKLHIGLVGLKDYTFFWNTLENLYKKNPQDNTLNDCSAISIMIKKDISFSAIEFSKWIDTGNLISLQHAHQQLSSYR